METEMTTGKVIEILEQEEADVDIERVAYMKSILILYLSLTTAIVFSGCYIILVVEQTDESISFNPDPIPPYDPGPHPDPIIDIVPVPPPHPIIRPVTPPRPQPDPVIHRPTHTGRDRPILNPTKTGNNEVNRPTRDSGIRRDPIVSNPAPARNDENNRPPRDSGVQKVRW
jgi:hypothetical protein